MSRVSRRYPPSLVGEAKKRKAMLIHIERDGRFVPEGGGVISIHAVGDPVAEKLAQKLIRHLLTRKFPPPGEGGG